MKREVQGILLVLFGGAILRISIGDVYLRYVKEGMRPWLLLTGALLVVLGVLAALEGVRRTRVSARIEAEPAQREHDGPDVEENGAEEHGHAHGGPATAWLLVLPVLAIFLIAPPALGAFTAERERATVAQPVDSLLPPLPPGDPVTIGLSSYATRAVWDEGRTLVGRKVTVLGFASPAPDGGWYLTRLTLACCAADALATKVLPVGGPATLPKNTWVEVTGSWKAGGATGTADGIPLIAVDSVEKVPAPENPYEQPG